MNKLTCSGEGKDQTEPTQVSNEEAFILVMA